MTPWQLACLGLVAVALVVIAYIAGVRSARLLRRRELEGARDSGRAVIRDLARRHGPHRWQKLYPTAADALAGLERYTTGELQ